MASDFEASDEDGANPHGFVYEASIAKYRKTKSELRKELKEFKLNNPKEKAYDGPK